MKKPMFITDRLPLKHFLGIMLDADDWQSYMPGILMCMPTRDEMMSEMTFMTKHERADVRAKLNKVQLMIAEYIDQNKQNIPEARDKITTRKEQIERILAHEVA